MRNFLFLLAGLFFITLSMPASAQELQVEQPWIGGGTQAGPNGLYAPQANTFANAIVAPVPEPSSVALLTISSVAGAIYLRAKRKSRQPLA